MQEQYFILVLFSILIYLLIYKHKLFSTLLQSWMIEKIFLVGGKMFDILVENAEKLGHGFPESGEQGDSKLVSEFQT